MSQIIIRTFIPETDSGFLIDFWPKNAYHASAIKIQVPKKKWFKDFFEYVKAAIKKDKIFIACLMDSPDTIIGCSVINGDCLEWIYVKDVFRNQGIEGLLISNKGVKEINTDTIVGKVMAERFGLKEKHGTENR